MNAKKLQSNGANLSRKKEVGEEHPKDVFCTIMRFHGTNLSLERGTLTSNRYVVKMVVRTSRTIARPGRYQLMVAMMILLLQKYIAGSHVGYVRRKLVLMEFKIRVNIELIAEGLVRLVPKLVPME